MLRRTTYPIPRPAFGIQVQPPREGGVPATAELELESLRFHGPLQARGQVPHLRPHVLGRDRIDMLLNPDHRGDHGAKVRHQPQVEIVRARHRRPVE